MAPKQINNYLAYWKPNTNNGCFWFYYFDGTNGKTPDVNATNFSIMIDLLRNEKPVYSDHTKGVVQTMTEPTGGSEPAGG